MNGDSIGFISGKCLINNAVAKLSETLISY
jgi:hypothetical protein